MTDRTRPGSAIDRDWYAWLVDPLPTAEFERDYYEQGHSHIRRNASTKRSPRSRTLVSSSSRLRFSEACPEAVASMKSSMRMSCVRAHSPWKSAEHA